MGKTKVSPCASHRNALQPHTRLKASRPLLPMWTVGLIQRLREDVHDQISFHISQFAQNPLCSNTSQINYVWLNPSLSPLLRQFSTYPSSPLMPPQSPQEICGSWTAMEQRWNQQDANCYGWIYGTQPTPALTYRRVALILLAKCSCATVFGFKLVQKRKLFPLA